MGFGWVFIYLALERGFELILSNRNLKKMKKKGAVEFYPETFPKFVLLHGAFFFALLAEAYPWRVTNGPLTTAIVSTLIALQLLRYWCISSLGENWNTRIVVLPGGRSKRVGPYRVIQHPNYLIVSLEFILLPLLFGAYFTGTIFSLVNFFIIKERISLEEKALGELTDYREVFAGGRSWTP